MKLPEGVHRIGPTRNGYRRGGYSQAYLFEDGDAPADTVSNEEDDGRERQRLNHVEAQRRHRRIIRGRPLSGPRIGT